VPDGTPIGFILPSFKPKTDAFGIPRQWLTETLFILARHLVADPDLCQLVRFSPVAPFTRCMRGKPLFTGS